MLAERLAERSYELAGNCLETTPRVFPRIEADDRRPLLDLAEAIGDASWADVRFYFDNAPGPAGARRAVAARALPATVRGCRGASGHAAYTLFAESAAALAQVDARAIAT